MTKKNKLALIAVAAHLVVAAVAIYSDVTQPPRARTWTPLLGGYLTTVLIVATALYAGNERIEQRLSRAAVSVGLSLVVSGILWVATFSVYLMTVLLLRRL